MIYGNYTGLSFFSASISSRDEAMNYEPLLEAILSRWKPLDLDLGNILLSEINRTNGHNEAGFSYPY